MSKLKSVLKVFLYLLAGFIGGVMAFFIMNSIKPTQQSDNDNGSKTTSTSKVTYNNTTSTTKAVKKVQDAVVSVINYQKIDTASSDNYNSLFGDSSESKQTDDGLAIFSEGSGVIYKKDGKDAYIVTNNHVIDGAKRIEILLADGSKIVGTLIGSDTYSDLAVVKVSSEKIKSVAKFADSTKINIGEVAIAIGSPLGTEYANSVTEGIVSSLSRTVTLKNEEGKTVSTNAIQTDAAINPGNSGGALINVEGQVIGINSSKISSTNEAGGAVEGMGFAIPSNDVVKIINQLEEKGEVIRPALGISMVNLGDLSTSALSQLNVPKEVTSGIVVATVTEDMPATDKLKQYDIITAIDGEEVKTTSDLQSALYGHDINDEVKITFYRGNEKKTVTVKLTKTTKDLEK
ncbi:trypsin-like peptidase domain-containing protein [Streptococcus parauberis]|uniref:Trypsin-like peptidase domain-containing protein n=1 Tax=Streptococcus parauberis TaxID=1348 RepID=A0AAE4KYL8_9STRE|nr:trypsin-like peptidase domain-containing protein [Streptococcus parauberis]MDT2731262.1 trypsin-like peptidase domain-containing protein [Streptococcus parauberis]ONH64636.1 Serine protease Do-like HtrA [Streptococcus parauberis]PCH14483.1 Serine protease Do-like HtrA [Streptococcus parauberis]PNY21055.1 Serine protease Do-like HtrA [Streptococcus parauberis]